MPQNRLEAFLVLDECLGVLAWLLQDRSLLSSGGFAAIHSSSLLSDCVLWTAVMKTPVGMGCCDETA